MSQVILFFVHIDYIVDLLDLVLVVVEFSLKGQPFPPERVGSVVSMSF